MTDACDADWDDLYDTSRRCEVCDITHHEDYGSICGSCDVWICFNCWPTHDTHTLHIYRSRAEHDMEHTRRASSFVLCACCGIGYIWHPLATEPWNQGADGPFLHRLCNGELVKL